MNEMNESLDLEHWTFTYYGESGGMVVTRRKTGVVVDAGLIGGRGAIGTHDLRRVARVWVTWRKDYEWQVRVRASVDK